MYCGFQVPRQSALQCVRKCAIRFAPTRRVVVHVFDEFAHYLSYGATDQQTARAFSGLYDGLLVPGTVAAFQADGTKGFVLTLSATGRTRYVIDPRFPLFQQRLPRPKKSHESLALLCGDSTLVNTASDPQPEEFDSDRCRLIASSWLRFNAGYTNLSSKNFDKYAARLGETIMPENASRPEYVLPPYFMASSTSDLWWTASKRLWRAHLDEVAQTGSDLKLVRVVAGTSAAALGHLLADVDDTQVAIWVDALGEFDTSETGIASLVSYRNSIRDARDNGKQLFALYGGFFSVLMAQFGLMGASHGIGYGEARTWRELPQSGPPPARFYLPKTHKYISQDLASILWSEARELVRCDCAECDGSSPVGMEYQQLMRHSVLCRDKEIRDYSGVRPADSAKALIDAAAEFESELRRLDLPRNIEKQAHLAHVHLRPWAQVLLA